MQNVMIDAGHGGSDPGATYKGALEKDVTLDVATHLAHCLRGKMGFGFFLTRAFDFFLSLQKRCELANVAGADLFISIHCNADPDDDTDPSLVATGEEIWVHPKSADARRFAEILQRHASQYAGVSRGIKASDKLYVLKHTRMPAVIVEIGFIDDPDFSSAPPVEKAANAIADAIEEYFNA